MAAAHLVAPSLYTTLAARAQLDRIPPEVRDALAALYQLNRQRNRRLRAVLRDTVQLLNQAGIAPLLLKGAIALLCRINIPTPSPGCWVIWTSRSAGRKKRTALPKSCARRAFTRHPIPIRRTMTGHHHLVPLFHPSGDGYVEIHRELLTDRISKTALSLAMMETCARPVDWDGARLWIPALEHRLLHNALHHQLQDQAFVLGRLSLRQLLEFAQLRALPDTADLDWPGLL